MARCVITNPRTLRRLSEQLGFRVNGAMTRGGTEHRIDAWNDAGEMWSVFRDGTIAPSPYRVAGHLIKPPDASHR